MWLQVIGDATLRDQSYHMLSDNEVYVVLGLGYNLDLDYRPIWNALLGKLNPKVGYMAGSMATASQKLRFVQEAITGFLNYTCGDVPVFPVGGLAMVDLTFFSVGPKAPRYRGTRFHCAQRSC